jgi:hypothetical protein
VSRSKHAGDPVTQRLLPCYTLENDMDEPQYSWQNPERRATPLHDLSDEEFDARLQDMIKDLEALHKEAA